MCINVRTYINITMRTDRSCIYNCDNNVVIHRSFETISSRRSIFFRPTFHEVNYRVYRRGARERDDNRRCTTDGYIGFRVIGRIVCTFERRTSQFHPSFHRFPHINYFEFYPAGSCRHARYQIRVTRQGISENIRSFLCLRIVSVRLLRARHLFRAHTRHARGGGCIRVTERNEIFVSRGRFLPLRAHT